MMRMRNIDWLFTAQDARATMTAENAKTRRRKMRDDGEQAVSTSHFQRQWRQLRHQRQQHVDDDGSQPAQQLADSAQEPQRLKRRSKRHVCEAVEPAPAKRR